MHPYVAKTEYRRQGFIVYNLPSMKLSVVIPVYNQVNNIRELICDGLETEQFGEVELVWLLHVVNIPQLDRRLYQATGGGDVTV